MKSPLFAVLLSLGSALPLAAQAPAEPKAETPKPVEEKKNLVPSQNVTVDEAEKLIKETPGILILDVRSPEEFDHEHLKGAVNVNVLSQDFEAELAKLDQSKPVVVHCASGRRSTMALETIQAKTKFPQIYHMNQGFVGWKKAEKPYESKPLPGENRIGPPKVPAPPAR